MWIVVFVVFHNLMFLFATHDRVYYKVVLFLDIENIRIDNTDQMKYQGWIAYQRYISKQFL